MPDALRNGFGAGDASPDALRADINADAGESFGPWRMGADERVFPYLTSVNLACGFHAGDPLTMRRAVALAAEHGVAVGAHPGFPDLAGFGRRDMVMAPDELHASVLYQLGALDAFLRAADMPMHHVKPHGALHFQMVRDEGASDAVARAIRDFDSSLPFVVLAGPGGSVMRAAAETHGLRVVQEAFPDRGYLGTGHLAPRAMEGALVLDEAHVAERAVRMVAHGEVVALDGSTVQLTVDTLCVHGDNPEAPTIARAVREALTAAGVDVAAF